MKLISVIIKPYKLDEARRVLMEQGIEGLTVTEVMGYGRQKGHTELYRGAEYRVDFLPKMKIEVAVVEGRVQPTIDAISRVANTGALGDGKIFISGLEQAVRIRTSEIGVVAL